MRLSGPGVCGVGYIGSTGLLVTDEGMGPGVMATMRWTLVTQPTMDACPNKFSYREHLKFVSSALFMCCNPLFL